MAKLRVLVVEDSLTVRRRLVEVLESDPDIEVVGEAGDGQTGFELCQTLRPDVVTLDMLLPVMTGLAATELIMAHVPTPILIVSSSTNRGDLFKTYEALAAGADDVLEKPPGDDHDEEWIVRFLAAVKLVSRIKVITHPRARLGSVGRAAAVAPAPTWPAPPPADRRARLVAIGASTGGPSALVSVLRGIPRDVEATILVVLHIDEPFGAAFAEWLGTQTSHHVTYPAGGELARAPGRRVFMAPPGRHLVLRSGRLEFSQERERHSCRPSIDVLFESIARDDAHEALGCLLTGMGRDGAQGLLQLRRAGAQTIAQDEETCVVYGMPREAALLGAAERILPLGDIGSAIARATLLASRRP
jgi:two-component system chemotaxis response regulator CheB